MLLAVLSVTLGRQSSAEADDDAIREAILLWHGIGCWRIIDDKSPCYVLEAVHYSTHVPHAILGISLKSSI